MILSWPASLSATLEQNSDLASTKWTPVIVQAVFSIIAEIRRRGTTVLLVEQNARMALSIADRGYVLQMGEVVLAGSAQELLENPLIQKAYLGGG